MTENSPFSTFFGPATLRALPILTYPGGQLTGSSVRQLCTDPAAQAEAQLALQERFGLHALMTGMDLSIEAEAFGAEIRFSDDEVPSVLGRFAANERAARSLSIPPVGTRRTSLTLNVVERLSAARPNHPVVAGMIGPFSLAGRLFGVNEILEATALDPALVHSLVDRTATFLASYATALKSAGARAILIAEPTAGLVAPSATREFSSDYVSRIVTAVRPCAVILHNCGARFRHLEATLHAGAAAYHFGAPMEIGAAARAVPPHIVLCGNLDPAGVFVGMDAEGVRSATRALLTSTAGREFFLPSSGCDIPAATPLANVAAFIETLRAT